MQTKICKITVNKAKQIYNINVKKQKQNQNDTPVPP